MQMFHFLSFSGIPRKEEELLWKFCGPSNPSGRNRSGPCPWLCNGHKHGTSKNHPGFEMNIAKVHESITKQEYLKLRFLFGFLRNLMKYICL